MTLGDPGNPRVASGLIPECATAHLWALFSLAKWGPLGRD